MIRSGACIMGTLLFAASFSVNALTSNDFDPAILLSGKKKPQRLIHWPQRPAKCVIIRIVQRGRMKKSDIQRERERRDQRRLQNQYKKYSHRD